MPGPGAVYLSQTLTFLAPVKIGDVVTARVEVVELVAERRRARFFCECLVDGKAASSHTHDDRYYTESEMNTKLNGKANASHTHDDRYYTESEMNAKLNGKANSSHTHNYAGSGSAGGTANSVNGLTFAAQTTDPGAGSALTTNKVLIVYV